MIVDYDCVEVERHLLWERAEYRVFDCTFAVAHGNPTLARTQKDDRRCREAGIQGLDRLLCA